jgi:hypothetical protein
VLGLRVSGVMMVRLAALAGLVFLAGCAQRLSDADIQASIDRTAAIDDRTCQSYGAAPGSQAYIQCRMSRDHDRAAIAGALGAAVLSR